MLGNVDDIIGIYFTNVPLVAVLATTFWIGLLLLAVSPVARQFFSSKVIPLPNTRNQYFGSFDFLRGFLALLVFFDHGAHLLVDGKLFLGVEISVIGFSSTLSVPFFAFLSGFVVWLSLDRARQSVGSIGGWIVRRVFRIYPLYFLHVAIIVVFLFWTLPMANVMPYARSFLSDFFMLHSLYFEGYFNTQSWSLYPEMLYSLLLPVFVLAVGNWRRGALLMVYLLFIATSSAGDDKMYSLFRFLAFGSLAAELLIILKSRRVPMPQGSLVQILAFFAVIIGFALLYKYGVSIDQRQHGDDWGSSLLPRIMNSVQRDLGFVLVSVGLVVSNPARALVTCYPLRAIGTISYSIYLMHFFVLAIHCPIAVDLPAHSINILNCQANSFADGGASLFILYLPVVLIVSTLTFKLIEEPCRNWGNQLAQRRIGK